MHDHIVMRLANVRPNLSILCYDIERSTLLAMIAQGYGITIASEATKLLHTANVTFLPILDEPEPLAFSAVWSPHNRAPSLRNILSLACEMARQCRAH